MTSSSSNNLVSPSQIDYSSAPWFVIRGDECCLVWLIKQICLLFQCCVSQETINQSLHAFSESNVKWLTRSQIEGLTDETIRQLGAKQLNALTPSQIQYFSQSQLAAYTQARRILTFQSRQEGQSLSTTDLSQITSETNRRVNIESNSQVMQPSTTLDKNQLQTLENDKPTLTNVPQSIEYNISEITQQNSTEPNSQVIQTSTQSIETQSETVEKDGPVDTKISQNSAANKLEMNRQIPVESNLPIIQAPTVSVDDLEGKKPAVTSNAIFPMLELDDLKDTPEFKLLKTQVGSIWDMNDDQQQDLAYLSLKLNGWLKPVSFSFFDREFNNPDIEIKWKSFWETVKKAEINLATGLYFLGPPKQENESSLNANLISVGNFEGLTAKEFFELISSNKRDEFCSSLCSSFCNAYRPDVKANEALVNAEGISYIKSLTLEQFRDLSAEKINSILTELPPPIIFILSRKQLDRLDTSLVNKAQVQALMMNAKRALTLESRRKEILQTINYGRLRDIQDKLSGYDMQDLLSNQLKSLDAARITDFQLQCFLDRGSFRVDLRDSIIRGATLIDFDPAQIRIMQPILAGFTMKDLTSSQTQAFDVSKITLTQLSQLFNGMKPGPSEAQIFRKFDYNQQQQLKPRLKDLNKNVDSY